MYDAIAECCSGKLHSLRVKVKIINTNSWDGSVVDNAQSEWHVFSSRRTVISESAVWTDAGKLLDAEWVRLWVSEILRNLVRITNNVCHFLQP